MIGIRSRRRHGVEAEGTETGTEGDREWKKTKEMDENRRENLGGGGAGEDDRPEVEGRERR